MRSGFARLTTVLAAGLFFAALPSPLFGQAVNATVLGTITDASGAVVPGAKVTITEVNTAISRNSQTNDSGYYVFSDLTPGTYTVSVEKEGFKTQVRAAVDVLVNTTVRVDLQLSPGAIRETVNVTAEAPLLETDRTDTGRKIEAQQLEDLPIVYNNRNFQGLLNLVPGTTRAFRPHSEFFNSQDSLSTQVNGNSRLANNLQFEGVDDNERTGLLQVYIPPIESIQTVDVTTSNYDAELGRAGGAVTNVVLKSGTNALHGAAYAWYRSNATNARHFFDRGPNGAPFHHSSGVYNYDGFNLGGPIKKNKVFFFGDFLHISDHRGQTNLTSVPTSAMRSGDLSSSTTVIYDPATGSASGSGRTQFVASSDPASPNFNPACTSAAGCPNIIPSNRIDPIAAKILALVPPPNLPGVGANFTNSTKFIKTTTMFDVKVEEQANANNHLSHRFSYSKPTVVDPPVYGVLAGGPHNGGFQGTGTQRTFDVGTNWDRIVSPTLIVETRVGVSRYRNVAQNADFGKKTSDDLGIPGVNLVDFTSGIVSVNGGGFSDPMVGYSASLPWIRSETNIDFVNNWTKTKANHTIKWGADIRRIRDDLLQDQTFNPRGTFNFASGQTSISGAKTSFLNNFASFLLGVPNQVGRDLPEIFPAYRATQLFFFGNDKWQVTPKLTADIGLRWELYPPGTPHFPGGFSNYDPNTNSLVLAGIGGNPNNLGMNYRKSNFAPRLGLAYRFTEKTVIRAGYGISYEPYPDNTYAYNFPTRQNQAFNSLSTLTPALLPDGTPATFAKGFPTPLLAAVPSNGTILANTPLLLSQSYDIIPKNFRNPYVESWNLAIQRALPRNFTFEVAYVGNHAVDVATRWNVNAGFVPGAGSAGKPLFQQFNKNADATISFIGTSANYNALQVKFDHRSARFVMTTAYTYSKSLDITDEDGGFFTPLSFAHSYGRAGFDRTHVFRQSYIYRLPVGQGQRWVATGPASKILGGWEVTALATLETGSPLTFSASGKDLNTPGSSQTANIVGPFRRLYGVDNSVWFDTSPSIFTQPVGAGVFGTGGRNIFAGPGYLNLDLALLKKIKITESVNLEFRSEFFSATNTPQFGNPNQSLTSSDFGHIRGTQGQTGGARQIDFGLKLNF